MSLDFKFQNIKVKKLVSILTNRFTFYVFFSTMILLAFILNIDKYKAELISLVSKIENDSYYFEDIDNDGNSEKIIYITKYSDRFGLMVVTGDKLIDHWDFIGEWANTTLPVISDYDKDGVKEIFVFTVHNDTILMHCLDAFNRKIEIENKVVCKTYKDRGVYDLTIYPCTAYDINADGFDEIFFSIVTGYSIHPRNMFAYYPEKDTILISPESCNLIFFPMMHDFDRDNIPEFIGTTLATGNCKSESMYTDIYSWLMVFTPEMEFKFPPVHFNAHPAVSQFFPYNVGKKSYILAFHYYEGTEYFPNFIALFDIKGKLIRKKKIAKDIELYFSRFFSRDEEFKNVFLLQKDGMIMQIDSMLNLKYVDRFENVSRRNLFRKMDIDQDGEKEFIMSGKNKGELMIYRNDFSNPVTLALKEDAILEQVSVIEKKGDLTKIFVYTNSNQYTFNYKITLLYKYRYVLFIPIFLLILFFHFIIEKIKDYRKIKMDIIQKQISELQVKSVQNQLDPHFTFNIFASFANLINEKDTERANFIFNKYAGLLKASVLNSENIHISLQEELDFVASYLELEKFRYTDKFTFQIKMQENIEKQLLVPKMILHIFVENAIKHGLRHLNSGGMLLIEGVQNNGVVNITIRDNGIGRVKAKELAGFSTGKGIHIIDKIIDCYSKLRNQKITYKINDLYENNMATGTEVIIQIPLCN